MTDSVTGNLNDLAKQPNATGTKSSPTRSWRVKASNTEQDIIVLQAPNLIAKFDTTNATDVDYTLPLGYKDYASASFDEYIRKKVIPKKIEDQVRRGQLKSRQEERAKAFEEQSRLKNVDDEDADADDCDENTEEEIDDVDQITITDQTDFLRVLNERIRRRVAYREVSGPILAARNNQTASELQLRRALIGQPHDKTSTTEKSIKSSTGVPNSSIYKGLFSGPRLALDYLDRSDTEWNTTSNIGVPETIAQMDPHVRNVYHALSNTKDINDEKLPSGWEACPQEIFEAISWEIVFKAVELHKRGSMVRRFPFQLESQNKYAEKHLSFDQRIMSICSTLRVWKEACVSALNRMGIDDLVAGPNVLWNKKQNRYLQNHQAQQPNILPTQSKVTASSGRQVQASSTAPAMFGNPTYGPPIYSSPYMGHSPYIGHPPYMGRSPYYSNTSFYYNSRPPSYDKQFIESRGAQLSTPATCTKSGPSLSPEIPMPHAAQKTLEAAPEQRINPSSELNNCSTLPLENGFVQPDASREMTLSEQGKQEALDPQTVSLPAISPAISTPAAAEHQRQDAHIQVESQTHANVQQSPPQHAEDGNKSIEDPNELRQAKRPRLGDGKD
ncbi:hypothetical protein AOQ84DRAFT_220545 [Glonium stellatum]|uniref:Uncharacterized protein n=1 Tax=Glonium stellatum TaxID=574774 RepID=A0A8E2JUH7_9PEZI|nr:hypothetical protein AOQ84DRAFT_220545 [Glonium stellatum]